MTASSVEQEVLVLVRRNVKLLGQRLSVPGLRSDGVHGFDVLNVADLREPIEHCNAKVASKERGLFNRTEINYYNYGTIYSLCMIDD